MARNDANLADRSGRLLESYKGYDPRVILFYFLILGMLLLLAAGLGYQQLSKTNEYAAAEMRQNQRRILVPGPRGYIYDREGRLLVGNRARFSARLLLDELRPAFLREFRVIRNNYRAVNDRDIPTSGEIWRIARVSVVQRHLDEVNRILGRDEKVNAAELNRHFNRELLLPFTLIDDLEPAEYARLLERLPVNSPASVYTFSTRHYPHGSAAAHTLGYVGTTDDVSIEDFPGEELRTFKMKGTMGRDGIEKQYDAALQGEAGGMIFRVDPSGNRINPPIEQVYPKQGSNVTLSLDIDLQLAAEQAIADTEMAGAAVALEVATGEVLVLASKPDYDLNAFAPRLSHAAAADMTERGAWINRATQGTYMPGSAFKILTALAGFREGVLTPRSRAVCNGVYVLGRATFDCHDRHAHGDIGLETAIERSCNVFFYEYGRETGAEALAAEARRFRLDRPTGIDLPNETRAMVIPDPEWKRRERPDEGPWSAGNTLHLAIGQGFLTVTPLQMACFTASVARGELWTQPTLLHEPGRPAQRHEPIGLTTEQRDALFNGMEAVTGPRGTARILQNGIQGLPPLTGLRIAAKTGTAQKHSPRGMINFAWLIAFAPVENPQIALAIAIEGDLPGEETGGGRYAAPVAHAILKKWMEKQRPSNPAARGRTG